MAATDPLLEMYLGGGEWAPLASDAYTRDPITITRGRPDQGARVDPGSCRLTLNNTGGVYSPRNPMSPYFGRIGRNTPIRVWVRGPEPYLWIPGGAGDRARVASSPALDVTGDLDVRVELSLDALPAQSSAYAPQASEIVGRYNMTGTNRSWRLMVDGLGQPYVVWSTDGADVRELVCQTPLPVVSGQRFALRVTLDVDDGAGGHVATFYTAPALAGPWTQLGDAVTGVGVTSVHAPADARLEIGDIGTLAFAPGAGRYYGMELRNGIDGPLLAAPDFTAQVPGATSFTDAAGNLWELQGDAALTDLYRRFYGEVASWPQRWHVSGHDVHTPVTVAGILRRLGRGAAALQSTLRRRIPAYSPVAYWPMEEGAAATQAYSPIEGVKPLRVAGLHFGSDASLPGSDALPTVGENASIGGEVPAAPDGAWHVELVYNLDQMPGDANETTFLEVATTGSPYVLYRVALTGGIRVYGVNRDGTPTLLMLLAAPEFTGVWNRFRIFAEQAGSNVDLHIGWLNVNSSGRGITESFTGTVGHVTRVSSPYGTPLEGMALGHLAAFSVANTAAFNGADEGFTGETAWSRLRRLAEEEGLPLIASGDSEYSQPMGPQRIATVLDNVEACADVDGGMLVEQRETLGLAYRGRDTLYNPSPGLVLDYTVPGEVAPPLEPVPDDMDTRNDVTVTRQGGSSARAVLEEGPLSVQAPPDGVGIYDESVPLNLATDDQAEPIAHWRLHLGTWDEARYPTVTVLLHKAPHLIEQVLSLDVGSVITISNAPPWLPPGLIELRVEGYSETIKPFAWEVEFNCSPAGPWTVGVIPPDDPAAAGPDQPNRVDTDGCQLAAAVDATAAELSVYTPQLSSAGMPLWADSDGYPDDYPVDVRVGGEVVRVAAAGPGVDDGFSRNAVDGWGSTPGGLVWTTEGGSASEYSVGGV